jgi:GAF domain-containing protein
LVGLPRVGSGGVRPERLHGNPLPTLPDIPDFRRRSAVNSESICRELDRMAERGDPFEKLIASAVQMLHDSNARFHWTGIYELFPDHVLRLGPFVGAPTDHVFIAVGKGVCGTAVAQKRNMNVPDVSKATNYLACSTSTRSELVVLIRKGGEIFAQIDIDSHEIDAFDPASVTDVERVADWLAEAYARRGSSRRGSGARHDAPGGTVERSGGARD